MARTGSKRTVDNREEEAQPAVWPRPDPSAIGGWQLGAELPSF